MAGNRDLESASRMPRKAAASSRRRTRPAVFQSCSIVCVIGARPSSSSGAGNRFARCLMLNRRTLPVRTSLRCWILCHTPMPPIGRRLKTPLDKSRWSQSRRGNTDRFQRTDRLGTRTTRFEIPTGRPRRRGLRDFDHYRVRVAPRRPSRHDYSPAEPARGLCRGPVITPANHFFRSDHGPNSCPVVGGTCAERHAGRTTRPHHCSHRDGKRIRRRYSG